jgi:hypothetical protein
MKNKTFEEYLEDKFYASYTGIKDNAEEGLDRWLSQLDVQEIIDYAQEWGNSLIK